MIEYIPENFIIAHWFVDQRSAEFRKKTDVPNMNWIACIWRDKAGVIRAAYRFAYFDDNERRKRSNWYSATGSRSAKMEDLIDGFNQLAQLTSMRNGNARWERVDLNLPGDKAIEILCKRPWMNIVAAYDQHELN